MKIKTSKGRMMRVSDCPRVYDVLTNLNRPIALGHYVLRNTGSPLYFNCPLLFLSALISHYIMLAESNFTTSELFVRMEKGEKKRI